MEKKVTLYMMVGIAGSGKSYIAQSIGVPVVSSDAIREELFGDVNDQSHNQEVFNEVHARIRNYLLNGQSCVYDATNLSHKRRIAFLKQLPKGVEKIAVLAATEIEVILEQNAARDRQVPEEVIMNMYKRIQIPRIDEGWDMINIIAHPKNKKQLQNYWQAAQGVDHDNPHHSADIGQHMIYAGGYVASRPMENTDLWNVAITAAMYHDIGKPVVKSRMKWNGVEDTCSHYYNHAEVGAYMAACCANWYSEKGLGVLRDVIVLIQWHMAAFEDKNNWLDKFEKWYGKELREVMELVHEADVNAH